MFGFLIVIAVLILAVLCDLLISHASSKRLWGYITSFSLTLLLTPTALIYFATTPPEIFYIIIFLGFALMWWFIYLNLAQAVESSLRIRILFEIYDAGGEIEENVLKNTYTDEKLIQLRLKRLQHAKAVEEKDGKYFLINNKLRMMARFFTALKLLIIRKPSQFDS